MPWAISQGNETEPSALCRTFLGGVVKTLEHPTGEIFSISEIEEVSRTYNYYASAEE